MEYAQNKLFWIHTWYPETLPSVSFIQIHLLPPVVTQNMTNKMNCSLVKANTDIAKAI